MIERLIASPMPSPSGLVLKKGSKTLGHLLRADSLSPVADENLDRLFVVAPRADAKNPLVVKGRFLHRLPAVPRQVHDDLLDLDRIGNHRSDVGSQFALIRRGSASAPG